uniref:Uncharacterized protein n=1 Tax=Zea mays TaxID=4577 RepID=C4J8A9_MAIZE|nr:unknown [Zea mays]
MRWARRLCRCPRRRCCWPRSSPSPRCSRSSSWASASRPSRPTPSCSSPSARLC